MLDSCKHLEKEGFHVTYLPVGKDGLIDLDDLKRALDDKTILVTIMLANNEIGTLQPIAEIGKLCHERGVLFHTDAVQAIGKVPLRRRANRTSTSPPSPPTRFTGPRASARSTCAGRTRGCDSSPMIDGGGHERGMRSGTLNVPGIVGFGKACELCREEMAAEAARLSALRDRLQRRIFAGLDEVYRQRLDGAPPARQSEPQLRQRGGRGADDGHQRCGGLDGLGLHVGRHRALATC